MRHTACCLALVCCGACSDPDHQRLKQTTVPTYDKHTGRLKELTYDNNKNGIVDTWVEMKGALPVFTKADLDEDGTLDRWEYYDEQGQLIKVGFSRSGNGKPDAWAFSGADGKVQRVEISSAGDDKRIDRWERYERDALVGAEEDTNRDGHADRWSTYENGSVKTVAFDENGDRRPDRRLTYNGADLILIESEPDAAGTYRRRLEVKQ